MHLSHWHFWQQNWCRASKWACLFQLCEITLGNLYAKLAFGVWIKFPRFFLSAHQIQFSIVHKWWNCTNYQVNLYMYLAWFEEHWSSWNGIFWEIFLNLKQMEIAKRPYNIICRSIQVMHFCQIIRAWLNIRACHTHLKFEI